MEEELVDFLQQIKQNIEFGKYLSYQVPVINYNIFQRRYNLLLADPVYDWRSLHHSKSWRAIIIAI